MPESDELFVEIAAMRDELEEQGAMIDALVRASGPELRSAILNEMDGDAVLREVFLLIDGSHSQSDIIEELSSRGMRGVSQANVSRKMDRLENELHLIIRTRRRSSGVVFKTTRLDRALGISRELKRTRKLS
jgi:DNA-binding transcriptional ArsR family regulator